VREADKVDFCSFLNIIISHICSPAIPICPKERTQISHYSQTQKKKKLPELFRFDPFLFERL